LAELDALEKSIRNEKSKLRSEKIHISKMYESITEHLHAAEHIYTKKIDNKNELQAQQEQLKNIPSK
jgi:hypothetical protein